MSSKRIIVVLALLALIVAAVCLLWLSSRTQGVSFSTTSSAVAPSSLATTSTPATATAEAVPVVNPAVTNAYDIRVVDGITFEIATSSAKQEQGLSGRETIPDNYAMLFAFSRDDTYGFWMKDMLQPLDMIWLSDNGTIISITHDATPASYPNVFYPPAPIRYVLETRVGLAAAKGWSIGTRVPLPLPYGNSVSK